MQKVNLYPYKVKVIRTGVTCKQIGIYAFTFFCALMLLSCVTIYKKYNDNKKLSGLENQEQMLNKNLETASSQISSNEDKEKLTVKLEQAKSETNTMQQMVLTLQQMNVSETKGFSEFMNALSSYAVPGLWFTNFSFAQGGAVITLSGETTDSENLPNLIKSLGDADVFSGKKFSTFKVFRDESEQTNQIDNQNNKSGTVISSETVKFIVGTQRT